MREGGQRGQDAAVRRLRQGLPYILLGASTDIHPRGRVVLPRLPGNGNASHNVEYGMLIPHGTEMHVFFAAIPSTPPPSISTLPLFFLHMAMRSPARCATRTMTRSTRCCVTGATRRTTHIATSQSWKPSRTTRGSVQPAARWGYRSSEMTQSTLITLFCLLLKSNDRPPKP